ncbi:MAG: PTS sugar transporter subunit IIB [Enterococcus avium]
MNVLLVCQAGMSTAILCKKISEVAEKAGQSLHIEAVGLEKVGPKSHEKQLVMLAPQVRYAVQNVRKEVPAEIPIMVINSTDFGLMNAEGVYQNMMTVMEKRK